METSLDPTAFTALVRARHSTRDFRSDPVPEELLQRVLDDACWAPSWTNTQPYFLAIASGEVRDRLAAHYLRLFDASLPAQRGSKRALVRMLLTRRGYPDGDFRTWKRYPATLQPYRLKIGRELYEHLGIDRGDRAARDAQWRRNCEFFGAPSVAFVFAHRGLLPFSAQDAGLMLQTLLLSAQANDLATCPLGVLATWRTPVDAEFEIPEDYVLLTGVAIGYASDAPVNAFRAGRRPVDRQLRG